VAGRFSGEEICGADEHGRSIEDGGEENIQKVNEEIRQQAAPEDSEECRRRESCDKAYRQGAARNLRYRATHCGHRGTREEGEGKAVRLEDVKSAYETLSGTASSIIRQLSLAGIGLIWLFNIGTGAKPALPHPLLQGALFIFLALFFDLLQYLVGTFTWFVYFRKKERAGTPPDAEFLAPAWINWPTWFLFSVKAACMLIAYLGFILPFLFTTFSAAA
jgi:hypothetical protein